MSKLMNNLEKQVKTDKSEDAKDCIKIYEYLKKSNKEGHVWSSEWNNLVSTTFKGFPSDERTYKPNSIGYLVLKGLNSIDNEKNNN